ncbi:MAG: hypothetical protein WC723_06690 [Candidatus Omnitrophota bacterium]
MAIDIILSAMVIFINLFICVIAIILTFFRDLYIKIDKKLNKTIFSTLFFPILDTKTYYFDSWMFKYHKIIGPILLLVSLIDMLLFLTLIKNL